jgi:hypothetical protein
MAALFLVNYPKIQKTWENVVGRNKHTEQNTDAEPEPEPEPELTPEAIVEAGQQIPPFETEEIPPYVTIEMEEPEAPPEQIAEVPVIIPAPAKKPEAPKETAAKPAVPAPVVPAPAVSNPAVPAPAVPAPAVSTPAVSETRQDRRRTLYFVSVDATGMVFIRNVNRMVATKGSPLIETLSALLLGPNEQEKKQGLSSLIPEGSRILSARVDGSTAFLNFNETFIFNGYGAEGYIAQLRQIIWTASEFSSVQDVQILIEGKKINFLGETIRVDRPINRNTL